LKTKFIVLIYYKPQKQKEQNWLQVLEKSAAVSGHYDYSGWN